MTPEEALAILNQIAAQTSMQRADHERAIEAVNTIAKLLETEDE